MPKKRPHNVFWDLVHGGPQTPEQLGLKGGVASRARMLYDIRKLRLPASSLGAGSMPQTKVVYYLHGYHDPEQVLRVWLEANRERLERTDEFHNRVLSHRLPDEFRRAWKAIRDEYEWVPEAEYPNHDGGEQRTKNCPFCGAEVHQLPAHLPRCDAA